MIGTLPKAYAANSKIKDLLPLISDERRDVLAVLGEVWALSPDVRLGQLLAHLGFLGDAHLGRGLGTIEDDELMAVLYRHRAELTARLQTRPDLTPQPIGTDISVSGSPTQPQTTSNANSGCS